jgi:hypothetical protein
MVKVQTVLAALIQKSQVTELQFYVTILIAASFHTRRGPALEASVLCPNGCSLPLYSAATPCPLTADPATLIHFKCAVPSCRCCYLWGD